MNRSTGNRSGRARSVRRRRSSLAVALLIAAGLLLAGGAASGSVPAHGDGSHGGGLDGGGGHGGHGSGGHGGHDGGGVGGDDRHGGRPDGGRVEPEGAGPPAEPPAPEAGGSSVPAAPSAKPSSSGSGGSSSSSGAAQSVPATSGTCDLRSGPVETSGSKGDRDLLQVAGPMSRIAYPCPYPPEWRAIRLSPSSIRLVVGGQLLTQIPFEAEGRAVGLDEITAAINDPSWLTEVAPGVFELRATFVQATGTAVAVRAPRVTTLRLVDLPGVAFAGNRSSAVFDGVTVTSWDPATQAPDPSSVEERPFVLYQNGSRLDIANSTFQYLGSDRTSSYGVSWRKEGTTGDVVDSRFLYNFFGLYTYEAANIRYLRNEVAYNASYGIDPHDATTGLVVEGNDVHHNGGHGIIFSKFVNSSVVRNNVSRANAGNGIMMDFHSDGNVIASNRVLDNTGEGIVSSASADLRIHRNEISGSEVGIRISGFGADRVHADRNVVRGVETAVKIYEGADEALIERNTLIGASVAGARVDSSGTTLRDNRVFRTPVGVDARAAVVVDGGVVEAKERALDVAPTGNVSLPSGEFTGGDTAIRVEKGGVVTRGTPVVRSLDSVGGGSEGRTLSLVGLLLVASAIALQVGHGLRNRRQPRRALAPSHVRNIS